MLQTLQLRRYLDTGVAGTQLPPASQPLKQILTY
jgi:hypothetical protein